MKLSIVIVNYNVQHFLEQCLHSVFNAIKTIDAEVWVVDNNSVDGSVEMVKNKFPEVKLIASKENLGFSKGNNLAIRKSQGKYILLLNPDTLVEEDTFEKVLTFMDETPGSGGLGVKMVDGKGIFLPESKRSLPTPMVAFHKISGLSSIFPKSKKFGKYHCGYLDKNKNHEIEILSGAFMLMRKEALDKVGLLDEAFFMYGEDIDLSYRLILGGYKNYYFADTRIIHYKGESTKKSSVNYVFVFYKAMIIFAKKHFSQKNASLFSFLINIAIYLRAGIAITSRALQKSILPLMDAGLIFGGIIGFKTVWENHKGWKYPEAYLYYEIPVIILIMLLTVAFFGGYRKKIKLGKVFNGALIGSIMILITYSLIDEKFRFSRAITIFSTIWAAFALGVTRLVAHYIKFGDFEIDSNSRKNVGLVGISDELERVKEILEKSDFSPQNFIFISTKQDIDVNKYVGTIDQLDEIIQIHNLDEVIFCAKDLSAHQIIGSMEDLSAKETEFKIAPPESLFVLGSSSINSPGELYFIDINSLNKIENIRNKRLFDVITSLILLLLFPLIFFTMKKPKNMLGNIIDVFKGIKTWVGYSKSFKQTTELPLLRKGILSPIDQYKNDVINQYSSDKINIQYVKDYSILNDLTILLKGLKQLGD